MAPAAYGDEDILGLLAGGSLSDALASQGAIPLQRRGRDGGEVRRHTVMGSTTETVGAASWGGGVLLADATPSQRVSILLCMAAMGACTRRVHKESFWSPPPTHTVCRAWFVCLLLFCVRAA